MSRRTLQVLGTEEVELISDIKPIRPVLLVESPEEIKFGKEVIRVVSDVCLRLSLPKTGKKINHPASGSSFCVVDRLDDDRNWITW